MDLRTKLVFALVLTALGSMFALGSVVWVRVGSLTRDSTLRHIEALAQTRKEAVEKLVSGWGERVSLVASRTQLRVSLRDHNAGTAPAAPARLQTILADALESVATIRSIVVRDARGDVTASVARDGASASDEFASTYAPTGHPLGRGIEYQGIRFPRDGAPEVSLSAPLELDGDTIGRLVVVLDTWELRELVESSEGMGETGQTILTARDVDGVPRFLAPERVGPSGRLTPLPDPNAPDPLQAAVDGREQRWLDVVDRRGRRIWAATRHVPSVGWGLTVAFDESEETAPLLAFRRDMTDLALSLSAIAILVGILLGLRFAKPLHDLAGVADRFREGDLGARAATNREDEIGLLSRTFNQMTEEVERQVVLLREFRRFFDVSLDLMCIAGTDGYFKRVNPAFSRTLGWSERELLEEPFFDLVHPDDVQATEREIGKLASGVPTVSFRNRFRTSEGDYRVLVWTSYPESESGLLYAIARDVTHEDG